MNIAPRRALLAFVMVSAVPHAPAALAQSLQTYDLLQFSAPEGSREDLPALAQFTQVSGRSFCRFGVYRSLKSVGDAAADFRAEWTSRRSREWVDEERRRCGGADGGHRALSGTAGHLQRPRSPHQRPRALQRRHDVPAAGRYVHGQPDADHAAVSARAVARTGEHARQRFATGPRHRVRLHVHHLRRWMGCRRTARLGARVEGQCRCPDPSHAARHQVLQQRGRSHHVRVERPCRSPL
jgi:hypothetical protein